ncbi:electron transfer flavoprotein subunit beta/FixA family protein [Thermoflexibacter ruber]|uniref:Electron transfer flavoprotein subunit beta n=1 Tax=Thermoflexibacter ruber TaxID=1003 RepID=A0A1I2F2J8_9BACT|nr:electron transfer flavoprotein subunit beta/FixA family protein [Thermoflexibacter ruber]SFE99634.1 electron transfer flavoprotein beta subunit [Thermoflexibacter ruber]
MKILVCISHVPDTNAKIPFKDGKPDLAGLSFVIAPYDDFALARAVELRDETKGKLTVLCVGKADTEPTIRKALAIGADDAIRIDAEPIDAFFVAAQIAEVAKQNQYDMILMGRESSDYNGGQVHGMVAAMLGLPCVVPCMKLVLNGNVATMHREIEGGKEVVELATPFVAGCQEPIAEWKIPNMRGIMTAKTKPLQVIPAVAVTTTTQVANYEVPAPRSSCKMIDANNVEQLVDLLKNEAKVI